MTIYSLYIYDRQVLTPANFTISLNTYRHCACVYYHDWHRSRRPKPANEGGILPAVCQAVYPSPPAKADNPGNSSTFSSPRNTLLSSTGVTVATNENPPMNSPQQTPTMSKPSINALPFDEEAKLVYGVMISLRNMVKKLSGRYVCCFWL